MIEKCGDKKEVVFLKEKTYNKGNYFRKSFIDSYKK